MIHARFPLSAEGLREFRSPVDLSEGPQRAGLRWVACVPAAVCLAVTLILWVCDLKTSHESPGLLIAGNLLFTTLVSLVVAYLVGRSYLARPAPGLLLLGGGMLVWGCSGLVGTVAGLVSSTGSGPRFDANATITIHNLCLWMSAVCYALGAMLSLRPRRVLHAPGVWLAVTYLAGLGLVAFVVLAVHDRLIPVFFIQGQGGTPVRQLVVGSTIVLLLITAGLLAGTSPRPLSPFIYWCALALVLIAVGLLGVALQSTSGNAVGWMGRSTQFLGGIYFLIAAIASVRESRVWGITMESALRISEQRYRLLFENMSEGFALHEILTDAQGHPYDYRFLEVNPAFERLTGMHRSNVVGKCVSEVLPDSEPHWLDAFGKVALTGEPQYLEEYSAPLNRWYQVFAYRPAPRQFAAVFSDISARRRAEAELLRERAVLDSTMRSTDMMLAYLDPAFNFVAVNPAYADTCRMSPAQMVGLNHFALYPDEENEAIFRRVRDTGTPAFLKDKPFEFPDQPERGRTYWDWSLVPVKDAEGKVQGMVFSLRETTAYKRAEQALRESGERFKLLSEVAARLLRTDHPQDLVEGLCREVMAHLNCDCFFNFLSDEAAGCLRLNAYAGVADAQADAITQLAFGAAICGCVFETGQRMLVEDVQHSDDPRVSLIRAYGIQAYACHPLFAQGQSIGTLSFGSRRRTSFRPDELELMRTVTDQVAAAMHRIRAECALRESEERFRTMADISPLMTWMTDPEGRLHFVNRAYTAFFGIGPDAVPSADWRVLVHPEDAEIYTLAFLEASRQHCAFHAQARVRRHDGVWRWIESYGAPRISPTGEFLGMVGNSPDITEAKQFEQERQRMLEAERAARMESEKLVRLKDEFLATVSHELRSPLNAIVGWTRLLARGTVEQSKATDIIGRSAASLTQIVEDLLDMNGIVSGKVRLNRERVDLTQLIMNAVESARFSAETKGLRLEVVIEPDLPLFDCDPNRIQQIVWNLLTNAIKFTPAGGEIHVRATPVPDALEIAVSDTGEGIKAEFLGQLFQRFRQQDGSIARRHGGLGLGLAIVRQLTELHGGTVRAESAGEGKGSTFVISLPRSGSQCDAEPVQQGRSRAVRPVVAQAPADSMRGLRVLAVDDDEQSGELLARLLSEAGAVVEMAHSAETALRRIAVFKPDLLISDIGMPDLDGYGFIRRVRSQIESGTHIPCLALTAFARPEDREQALAAGFDEHLPKPYDADMLTSLVHMLIGQRCAANGRGEASDVPVRDPMPAAHLLLAEDNASISEMLKVVLESEGYRVSVAASVAEALAHASEKRVDLLVSDLRLQDGTGWDLLSRLQTGQRVPGLMMSGYSDSVYVNRSKAVGFAEFLVKPVDTDELLGSIRRILAESVDGQG